MTGAGRTFLFQRAPCFTTHLQAESGNEGLCLRKCPCAPRNITALPAAAPRYTLQLVRATAIVKWSNLLLLLLLSSYFIIIIDVVEILLLLFKYHYLNNLDSKSFVSGSDLLDSDLKYGSENK